MNATVVRALVPTLPALLPWRPFAASAAAVAVLVAVDPAAPWLLRGTALLVAAASAFALDDPAGDVLAPSPTSLAVRRGIRLAVVFAWAAVLWGSVAAYVTMRSGDVSVAGLAAEAGGLLAVTVAAAGVLWLRRTRTPGALVAPAVPVVALATAMLPGRWALLGDPTQWTDAGTRWLVVLAGAAVVLAWTSRDPAARGVRRFRVRTAGDTARSR